MMLMMLMMLDDVHAVDDVVEDDVDDDVGAVDDVDEAYSGRE
jgi:hypothetical protein